MDRLSPAVLEAYGLTSRRIKKEKGQYLCDTDKGPVKVQITQSTPEAIIKEHSIKEHLAKSGFPFTDRIRLTKTGQPYILMGMDTYVITPHLLAHRETDFENDTETLQAFKSLACLHVAASNMPKSVPIQTATPLPELYNRQKVELAQAGKQARRSPRLSDFDVAFIKHIHHYSETIQDAIDRLHKTNYQTLYTHAITEGSLCHNNLKEENLLASDTETSIVNFSQASIDLQLADLAALIRRYAQRSSKSLPMGSLLAAYNQISPLPSGATDILYAQLIFPWAFMKIITQYYSKKRNWTPNSLLSRMDTILAEQESYDEYIIAF